MAFNLMNICGVVTLWWIANTIATIFSKQVMNQGKQATSDIWGLTTAFSEFRWLELTFLQHFLGGVIGLIWIKLIRRNYLYSETSFSKLNVTLASLGNGIGNLATNAAYSFVSSSSVQILKGIEPLVTFVLAIFLYRKGGMFTVEILVSILMICVGASSFVAWDSSFNVWGVVAALISDIAFPVRNVFLKRVSWENPLQKYTSVSLLSAIFLIPALLVKLLTIHSFSDINIENATFSSLFHCIYNFASISVLENVTPLTHSILNLSKRMFVVILNILYFSTPLSKNMLLGLLTFFIGITMFQIFNNKNIEHSRLKIFYYNKIIVKFVLIGLLTTMCIVFLGDFSLKVRMTENTNYERISTVWVYDTPIPEDVVSNVESFQYYSKHLYVYCGTNQCIDAFQPLSRRENVSIQFLDISEIVKETPFESWFAQHVYHKILTGRSFERHLDEVVKISLLWNYGGVYINPSLVLPKDQNLPATRHISWISLESHDRDSRDPLDVSFFPRGEPLLTKIAADFVNSYPRQVDDNSSNWPVEYDYRKVINDSLSDSCDNMNLCINTYAISTHVLEGSLAENAQKHHYGTLSYDSRVATVSVGNLGDEVQSFPGIQFLPYIDTFLDREELASPLNDQILVFFNAWWGDSRMNFPPPENIDPIPLGMHFAPEVRDRSNILDFVKQSKFIGSRDMNTYKWLRSIGVETFFSSCLTLLTKSPTANRIRPTDIYMVDVKMEFLKLIPEEVRNTAITWKQDAPKEIVKFRFQRMKRAFGMIRAYSQAKLVITQRIHCALPSAAMGTPVLFINSYGMPGGAGTGTVPSPRIVGLLDYFHTVDTYSLSEEKIAKFLLNFDYSSPPPNPNVNLLMRDRAVSWNVIRQRQPLYDAARKFGLLPLSSTNVLDNGLVFHFVITSSRNHFLFDSSSPSLLNLRNRRSIESILYHHPLSRVLIHTNMLFQADFDVYTESGYRVEVLGYELNDLLMMSPIGKKIDTQIINRMKNVKDWPHLENYLVQLLVLYQSGGIYLNSNSFLLSPIEDTVSNSISLFEDNSTDFLTFMKFGKKDSMIKHLLDDVVNRYELEQFGHTNEDWSFQNTNQNIGKVEVLHSTSTNVFDCDIELYGETIREKLQRYSVLTVEDTSTNQFVKRTAPCGSIWEWINQEQCILCNEIY